MYYLKCGTYNELQDDVMCSKSVLYATDIPEVMFSKEFNAGIYFLVNYKDEEIIPTYTELPPNNEIWFTSTERLDYEYHPSTTSDESIPPNFVDNIIGVSGTSLCPSIEYDEDTHFGKLIFSEDIVTIGQNTFHDCTILTSIALPKSITTIDGVSTLMHMFNKNFGAFEGCNNLQLIVLPPKGLKTINGYAFYGCTSLDKLKIPKTVTTIGDSAFYNVPIVRYTGTATGSPWNAKSIITE